jgi:tetratricopeptide (TPR) repeat protein
MSDAARRQEGLSLAGVRVALVGRLSGMSRRDAQRLIREHGGVALERADATARLLVVSDESSAADKASSQRYALRQAPLDELTRAAVARGEVEVIGETELWQRLGLVDAGRDIQRLYTPAMLANLLKVDVITVRRWQRRGLIRPARTVRRLAYFDFEQVIVARQLAALLASGVSPAALERRIGEWNRRAESDPHQLADYELVAGGRHLLRRHEDRLLEASGQQWFSFVGEEGRGAMVSATSADESTAILPLVATAEPVDAPSAETLVRMAEELEDQGDLSAAADLYRAALAAGGPSADLCFALAELFYRLRDLAAARERYFMAIELDENFVEARANLGCLLAEQGRLEIAAAAFEGALRYHPDYADAHYHLARTLHDLGRRDDAAPHWEAFLRLAPDSPWAAEVRLLLALDGDDEQENH